MLLRPCSRDRNLHGQPPPFGSPRVIAAHWLTLVAPPSGLRSKASIYTSGSTDLHAPLMSGSWNVRIYEEGHAHPIHNEVGDLMDVLHFTDAKQTAYTMNVTYTLPAATTSGNFTASLATTDQTHSIYSCVEVRYVYGEVVSVTDMTDAVRVTNDEVVVADGPHFWSCGSSKDLLQDMQVKITPPSPVKGNPVTIAATGKITQGISNGTVHYTAALDGITLISKTDDLCSLVKKAGKSCPLTAGEQSIGITYTIPSWAPSGNYSAKATATTGAEEITCLQGWFQL